MRAKYEKTLHVDDEVRIIEHNASAFKKSYEGVFSKDIYVIYDIIKGPVRRYLVKRQDDNSKLKKSFYFSELRLISDVKKYYWINGDPNQKAQIKRVYDSKNDDVNIEYLVDLVDVAGRTIKKWISPLDLHDN